MKEILTMINQWYVPRVIEYKLNIPIHSIRKELKKAKELWYTKVQWYGWSWCTCTLSENQCYCDCEWSPFVWRRTVLTKQWIEYINN